MTEEKPVRVVVWTPCSVLVFLGCGGVVLVWLLGAIAMLIASPSDEPTRTPEPTTTESAPR